MSDTRRQERILIVAKDEVLRTDLSQTLNMAEAYTIQTANTFEEALSEILMLDYDLILTEAELPDLSGMDLLAVVAGLRPGAKVIIIDDDLSAKSAVAVFRLGAVDYLYKPLDMSFVFMQVERHLEEKRQRAPRAADAPATPKADDPREQRAKRLDPRTRPVSMILNRQQFQQINQELNNLLMQLKANFVGLVDVEGNMVGAAGSLDDYDLQLLREALSMDHGGQKSLASMLDEQKFHSTYMEGKTTGVHITEFGTPNTVTLAVIVNASIKQGAVQLYARRTVSQIDALLQSIPQPKTQVTGMLGSA
jgi:DNA-binding response OmpR family regulator